MAINRNHTPGHVSRYFGFFSDFVRLLNKGDGNFITQEQLNELEERYEAPVMSFIENTVIIEIDGVFELDNRVSGFISFCNNDFALNSPETVQKFHYSLSELYKKLLAAREDNEIILYSNQLISELSGFSVALEESVTRLLKDTLLLKENIGDMNPRERFDSATEVIDRYVDPLKKIIEDGPQAILPLIRDVMSLANLKTGNFDPNMDGVLRRLRLKADSAHKDTERFGRTILSELLTLRKIKKSSLFIEGAISWLDNINTVVPTNMCAPFPFLSHSKEFFFESIDELEWMIDSEEDVIIPSEEDMLQNMDTHYHFNKEYFLELFDKEKAVGNIYQWIYDTLIEKNELTYESFCASVAIMDDLNIAYETNEDNRQKLDFEDFVLNVPIASATISHKRIKNG